MNSIADLVNTNLRIVAENPALVRFWQYVYAKEIHSGKSEFIEEFFKGFIRTLSRLLAKERVKDPDKTAIVLMAMLEVLATYSTFMDLGKIEDFEEIILDFIESRRLKNEKIGMDDFNPSFFDMGSLRTASYNSGSSHCA